jgi:hypothetical protein
VEGLGFKEAQELGLEALGEFSNAIEKERAMLSGLEEARFSGGGAGEGAAFVAEEFSLDEIFWQGGAGEIYKWIFPAGGIVVEGAGDDFLAGAGFPDEKDGGVALGYFANLGEELAHARGSKDCFSAEKLELFDVHTARIVAAI